MGPLRQMQAAEDAKIEQAKADLVDESGAGEGELILGKYGSTEELANAYQSLQREYSKLKVSSLSPRLKHRSRKASLSHRNSSLFRCPTQDGPTRKAWRWRRLSSRDRR